MGKYIFKMKGSDLKVMDNKENAQQSKIEYSIWNTRTKDQSGLLEKDAHESPVEEAEQTVSREENLQ